MPKIKPKRANDYGLTHAQEMTRRKLARASRIPFRESRNRKFWITDADGNRWPKIIPTMIDGIRIRILNTGQAQIPFPRSRTYRYTPVNFRGAPRR